MTDAGQLRIHLNCAAEKVASVDIQSTRPLHISRLFIGKTPQQTLAILPLLFNVCGIAQAFAAHTACSRALGLPENSAATQARRLLLNVEMIREHCWWLLFERDKTRLAPFLQFISQFKTALFAGGDAFSLTSQLQVNDEKVAALIAQLTRAVDDIFSGQREAYCAVQNQNDLHNWLKNNDSLTALLLREICNQGYADVGRVAFLLLPALNDAQLNAQLNQENAAEFSRCPHWQGQRYETSCMNRQQQQPLIADLLAQYGNGLLTRVASRLLELAKLPTLLVENQPAMQTATNIGIAQIQTSRGLLIHRVTIDNCVIADYQIIAPTEWNFQPNGLAALSLQQLSTANKTTLQQQATLLIHAIDPCVAFELIL